MAAIWLGQRWYPDRLLFRSGWRCVYKANRHITIFGPTRSGKGVSLEMPNLLRLKNISIVSIDPKGQNAAVTARWRRTVSDVVFLNPFDLHGLGDAGFNPLAWVQSYEDAAAVAEALQQVKSHEPFFPESAQGLLAGIILAEVREAAAQTRVPTLENVRRILTGDLVAFADAMSKSGDFQVASLVASFVKENRTLDAIKKTADTATKWLLSEPISRSLSVPQGIDFAALKGPRPLTVYVILDTDKLESFAPWLRLVVVCALRALYRQGGKGLRTLFMLSEAASFGKLEPLATAMTQGAGFGIQLMQVWQDINQARAIFGRDQANTFLGMSGATFAFAPNDPETAEWMSLRSGEIIAPECSFSDNPQTGDVSGTWRGGRRRLYPAHDMYDIPEFHGLAWFAGRSAPRPVVAKPYWELPALKGRYDPDPFHSGTGGGVRSVLRRVGKFTRVAAASLALLVGAWSLLPAHMQRDFGRVIERPWSWPLPARVDPPKANSPAHRPAKHDARR